jgi:hypothetical protein
VRFGGALPQGTRFFGRALTEVEQLRARRHHPGDTHAVEVSEATLPRDVAEEPPGHGVAWRAACPG